MKKMNRQQGFTLIELMIVVAIIGIIAGIAYPSYMESVRKSNRSDAKASLNDVAQRLQRCFTVYNAYNHGSCSVADSLKDGGTIATGERLYTVSAPTLEATRFELWATPVVGKSQASDSKCGILKLANTGVKSASGNLGIACW